MKFEILKEKFKIEKLEYWKPQEGKYKILIDLGQEPEIRKRKFKNGEALFAEFVIQVKENGKIFRKKWSIPIAKAERDEKGELIIYFWEKSQRGAALKEIADKYGYQPHILEVEVKRDHNNPLNVKYTIRHDEECECNRKDFVEMLKRACQGAFDD